MNPMGWHSTKWEKDELTIYVTEEDDGKLYHFKDYTGVCHHFTSLDKAATYAEQWVEGDYRYTGFKIG